MSLSKESWLLCRWSKGKTISWVDKKCTSLYPDFVNHWIKEWHKIKILLTNSTLRSINLKCSKNLSKRKLKIWLREINLTKFLTLKWMLELLKHSLMELIWKCKPFKLLWTKSNLKWNVIFYHYLSKFWFLKNGTKVNKLTIRRFQYFRTKS